jgi:branched-chain amino acid transport system substrate-binding protein
MSIVAELSYEPLDPTVDSQIVALKGAGADIFFDDAGLPKFAAQAIKKVAEIGWKPLHLLVSLSNSVGSTLKPAGLEISEGIISTAFAKDPTDPQWQADPA